MYKRALDSPQQNPNKPSKIARKSLEMICGICGDRAIGFNYDVLSCASCKSFFRRNAHQDIVRLFFLFLFSKTFESILETTSMFNWSKSMSCWL